MTLRALSLAGLAASIIAAPAVAHHSTAIFDQTKVNSLTGTVKEFEWINPHVWLHLTIANAGGQAATWSFEAGSTAQLIQLGWKPESFRVGDKVEIGFRPMRDGSRGGQLMRVTLPNGQKVCSNRGCG
jgi:hypothetical protein